MKKIFLSIPFIFLGFYLFTGQSQDSNSPRWNPHPSTRINSGTVIDEYSVLPQTDYSGPVINEPQYIQNEQGVFVVNSAFRVHPISPPSGHQTEVPITRHPSNPLIMFGSANTSRGGNFSTGWYVTTNGGNTWFGNDTLLNSVGSPVFNFGDPGPVIDGSGRFLNSYITLTGAMGASYSTNNGANWSSTVTFPSSTTSSDKNLSSTDDVPASPYYLRSYTYYTEFASGSNVNRIMGTYTTNGGVNWSTVAPVSPTPSASHFHQGADTRVGPNGEVYVVWTTGVLSSPFTEDYLGFAKSTNGGVSWVISNENVANVNGNRTFNMMNGIRVAGFPRIDVDRTCGPRAGWIYVCIGEKNPGIAGDISDVTLYKSTNGGTTWSSGVRVNQDTFGNGRKQYMGAIRVDESGAVNVVYYDTRNTPTGDSAEVYLSRSTDGGVTFADLKVGNKFKHAPTGVAGVNTQYAGDYIGITSALIEGNPVNGNQRIWPYWTSNLSGLYNAWTAKVELLPKNPCVGCEDFTSTSFTPKYFHLDFTGSQFWTRQAPSAYGVGSGSAKYDFFSDNVRTPQNLITDFEAVPAGYYLTFDEAYAPYGISFPGPDTLIVESSTNGGNTYTTHAVLLGKVDGSGELNTAPATTNAFVPTNSQWASKIYSLPAGTNRVRLRAESGFGNNLYLDNICVQALPTPSVVSSIGVVPQGFYRPLPTPNAIQDTVRAYLHRTDFPNIAVDSAISYYNTNAVASSPFTRALSGNYYIVLQHRNSLETWSKSGGENYNRGSSLSYNFVQPDGQAYGNNQAIISLSPFFRGLYGGDCNKDGLVDISDLAIIDNDAFNFASGYVISDLNGDNFADLSDYAIADNNAFNIVTIQAPPGAAPEPVIINNDNPVFNTEAEKTKYEMHLRLMKEKGLTEEVKNVQGPVLNEVLKQRKERDQNRTDPVRKTENIQNNQEKNSSGFGTN